MSPAWCVLLLVHCGKVPEEDAVGHAGEERDGGAGHGVRRIPETGSQGAEPECDGQSEAHGYGLPAASGET